MYPRIAGAVLAALVLTSWAGAPPAAPADDAAVTIAFERYKLDNGLEVILVPDNTVPLVAVNVWYHVGSGHEVVGKSGFAHLFEHMLFQGSRHVGNDRHFELLKNIGADSINGTTNPDRTNYFELVPSNQLETALWLESDRMAYLLPTLTKESLDNQIEVVRNERRQRYDNQPYSPARFALYEELYPPGHPYRHLTIGKHEDLTSASLDDVIAFFRTWYVPSNATLALSGDFDVATAKQLVDRWFGSLPKSTRPTPVRIPPPPPRAARREVGDKFAKLRQITWAWHSPARFEPGDAELSILAESLGREGTGRLYRSLVHEKQLAQSVSVSQNGSSFSGIFGITVTLRTGADLAEVERVVREQLELVRREHLAARELARVVTRIEAAQVWGLESLMARANQLQTYNHYLGDPGRLAWDLGRYRAATPQTVLAAAKQHVDLDRPVVIVTMPEVAK